jgi:hypothetical protein
MNIGFDLDKVFINTPPFIPKTIIDKLYKKKDNGTLIYRIPGKSEQIIRRISHLSILRPPMKKNLEFLQSIIKEKNKLYLISSRFKFLESRTNKMIQKYKFNKIFEEMYFNFLNEQPHVFKNRIIKKLNLDYYVDDDLSLLNYVAPKNPNTYFFWLSDKSTRRKVASNIIPLFPLSELSNINWPLSQNFQKALMVKRSRKILNIQIANSK